MHAQVEDAKESPGECRRSWEGKVLGPMFGARLGVGGEALTIGEELNFLHCLLGLELWLQSSWKKKVQFLLEP